MSKNGCKSKKRALNAAMLMEWCFIFEQNDNATER